MPAVKTPSGKTTMHFPYTPAGRKAAAEMEKSMQQHKKAAPATHKKK